MSFTVGFQIRSRQGSLNTFWLLMSVTFLKALIRFWFTSLLWCSLGDAVCNTSGNEIPGCLACMISGFDSGDDIRDPCMDPFVHYSLSFINGTLPESVILLRVSKWWFLELVILSHLFSCNLPQRGSLLMEQCILLPWITIHTWKKG